MGLLEDLFEKPKPRNHGTHSFLDDYSEEEKRRIKSDMKLYDLDDGEKEEVIEHGYDPMDFDEEDLDDDSYYNDD